MKRSSDEIRREINEVETLRKQKQNEVESYKEAFSSETDPIYEKIYQEEENIKNMVIPKVSPLFTIGILAFVILGFVILFDIIKLSSTFAWICFGAAVVVLIVRAIIDAKIKAPYKAGKGAIEQKIKEYETEIEKIESKDPRIAQNELEIRELYRSYTRLQSELEEAEIREIIGDNNVIVYASPKVKHYPLTTTLKIDGVDKGIVSQPFRIVSLPAGIHSISVTFDLHTDKTWTTHDVQFSLKDDNKFFIYNGKFDSNGRFDFDAIKSDSLDSFLSAIKIDKTDFKNYIERL